MNKYSLGLTSLAMCFSLSGCSGSSGNPNDNLTDNFCQTNVNNFTVVESLSLAGSPTNSYWGPNLANLPFPSSFESCKSNTKWNQVRLLYSALNWVNQKVNYCHHHVPTWVPQGLNQEQESAYTVCSNIVNVMPGTTTDEVIRWNYSGITNESAHAWYYFDSELGFAKGDYGNGLDCSDYSKLNYAYAESIYFTSNVSLQAGQSTSESILGPNTNGFIDSTESDYLGLYSAGRLVCADGILAPPRGTANSSSCNSHGGYISVFNNIGQYVPNSITESMLNNLQPGDLIFIAGCGSNNHASTESACNYSPQQLVTHVVMWTGQQIGSSALINESMIAPEIDRDSYGIRTNECGTVDNPDWWSVSNNLNNWIITDSHYQGPDFRAFTNCFYQNQIWGVRRVLGVN